MSKHNIGIVTLRAAHDFLGGKSVKLGDLQELCVNKPKHVGQRWSFTGNWKRSVAPIYHSN